MVKSKTSRKGVAMGIMAGIMRPGRLYSWMIRYVARRVRLTTYSCSVDYPKTTHSGKQLRAEDSNFADASEHPVPRTAK